MRRLAVPLAVGLAAAGLLGCSGKSLETVDQDEPASDYGQGDLMAAVAEAAKAPTSPQAFRALAVRVEELRPRFNDRVAEIAELQLAFQALGPLTAQLAEPPEAQLAALATTVWPTALRVEPEKGETPRQYLERVCSGPLAGECKYVVPEAWPVVMSAKVWRRLKTRARDAYADCFRCQDDPTYAAALETYDRHDTEWQSRARTYGDRAAPSFWPRAGGHAAPWSGAPLLELGTDTVSLAGEDMGDDEWRRMLRERRGDATVLGVHLRPRQEVRTLRAALADAAAAGWHEVALQVRDGSYPWELREYRLATRRKGAPLQVRDVDSIQVLVQALDVAAGRLASRDGARSPIEL